MERSNIAPAQRDPQGASGGEQRLRFKPVPLYGRAALVQPARIGVRHFLCRRIGGIRPSASPPGKKVSIISSVLVHQPQRGSHSAAAVFRRLPPALHRRRDNQPRDSRMPGLHHQRSTTGSRPSGAEIARPRTTCSIGAPKNAVLVVVPPSITMTVAGETKQ